MKKYSYIFKYISIIIILLIVYFYYVYAFTLHNVLIHHDSIFPVLMADDILHGNLNLKDWYGVTNQYIIYVYTCLLLPYSIFGFGQYMYVYYPAFIMLILSISIYLNIYRIDDRISKFNIFLFICLILIFPSTMANILSNVGFHVELYPYIFISLFLINKIHTTKKIYLIYIILFLLFITLLSYKFMYYLYLIPMSIVIIYRNIYIKYSKREIITLLLLLFAFGVEKLIEWIIKINGGEFVGGSGLGLPNIIQYEMIPSKIFNYYLGSILKINDSFPFSKSILGSIPYIAKLLIIIFALFKIITGLLKLNKEDMVNQYLIVSIFIFSCLLIFTTIQERIRYFVPLSLMIYTYFLRIDILNLIKRKYYELNKKKYYTYIIIIIIVSILHLGTNFVMPKNRDINKIFTNEISELIQGRNLKYGYATPYFGLIPSFYIGSKSNVGMLIGEQYNIPYTWADNIRWYERYSNYIIARDGELNRFLKTFGEPKEHIIVDNNIHSNGVFQYSYNFSELKSTPKIHILIYDKDLSIYLLNNNFISTMKCSKKIEGNDIIEIKPNTSCNGPYIPWNNRPNLGSTYLFLHKGEYLITMNGNNLDKLEVLVGNRDLKTNDFEQIKLLDFKKKNDKITFKISIEKKLDNVEFILKNQSMEDIVIKQFFKKTINY